MKRRIKAGIGNMAWRSWDDTVQLGIEAEKAGHKIIQFTDLMVRYLFREQGEQIFGKEKLAPGPLAGIPNNGVQALPYGPELMGVTDPLLQMAGVAMNTSKIELLLACIDCVRHVPQKLAQSFLSLDHISKGRSTFTLGGSEMKQLSPYGFSRIGSAKKLEESLKIVKMLFEADGKPVYFEGEHYSMRGGEMPIRPYGANPPKVYCAPGVSNEVMGRWSDGMLTNTKRHPGGLEGFKRDLDAMRKAAKAAGRDPDDIKTTACAMMVMNDDPKEVDRLCGERALKYVSMLVGQERGEYWREFGYEHPMGEDFGYAKKLHPHRVDPDFVNAAIDKCPMEAAKKIGFHSGSVDQIYDELQQWTDAGLDSVFLVDYSLWVDHSLAELSAANHRKLISLLQD